MKAGPTYLAGRTHFAIHFEVAVKRKQTSPKTSPGTGACLPPSSSTHVQGFLVSLVFKVSYHHHLRKRRGLEESQELAVLVGGRTFSGRLHARNRERHSTVESGGSMREAAWASIAWFSNGCLFSRFTRSFSAVSAICCWASSSRTAEKRGMEH